MQGRQVMASESPAVFLSRQHPLVKEIVHLSMVVTGLGRVEVKHQPSERTQSVCSSSCCKCAQQGEKLAPRKFEEAEQKSDWWTNFLRKRAMTGVKYRESSA